MPRNDYNNRLKDLLEVDFDAEGKILLPRTNIAYEERRNTGPIQELRRCGLHD